MHMQQLYGILKARPKLGNKPVFRGMASIFEVIEMGMTTLQYSADIALPEENDQRKVADFLSTLFAIVLAILLFMVLPIRLLFHLPMVPFVAGVGYEGIKLSARSDSIFFNIFKKPGLWLQNITTQQPKDDMVEVSITALKEAFGDQYNTMIGKEYTAEAIG